jgi:hypothetical protein
MTLTYSALVFLMLLNIGAYYLGKDAGIDEEMRRNRRRQAHRSRTK